MIDPGEVLAEVRSPIGSLRLLAGGVVLVTVDRGLVVEASMAPDVERLTAELAGDQPIAVVADIREMGFGSAETREAFASQSALGREVATAQVVKEGLTDFMARRFEADQLLDRPFAVFRDVDEAVAWAREQVEFRRRA